MPRVVKNEPSPLVKLQNTKGDLMDEKIVNHLAHLLRELGGIRFMALLREACNVNGYPNITRW